MKDSLFINSGLSIKFQTDVMNIINYFCNELPTKYDSSTFIPKEAQTNTKQNLEYIYIFESGISIFIPNKKYTKSDI